MYNLIFDCDGGLVDSEHLSCGAWLPVLARHGVEAEIAEIETMIGKSDRAVLDHFSAKTGIDFPPEILAERQQEYFRQAAANLEPFPGLPRATEWYPNRKTRGSTAATTKASSTTTYCSRM